MRNNLFLGLLMTALTGQASGQAGFVAQSQTLTYNVFDQNGKSFVNTAPDVAGSPFFKDEWKTGLVILADNRKFDSVKTRLNLLSQEVHFLDKDNREIALAQGYIKEVIWPGDITGITGGIRFQCGFPAVDAQDAGSFYEVLSEGKLWLLQSLRKVIAQQKDEMSGEVRKEYQLYEDYYVYDGKTMQRVKKDKSFFLNLMSDKKEKIGAFVSEHKLKFKSGDDMKQTIEFYNSL